MTLWGVPSLFPTIRSTYTNNERPLDRLARVDGTEQDVPPFDEALDEAAGSSTLASSGQRAQASGQWPAAMRWHRTHAQARRRSFLLDLDPDRWRQFSNRNHNRS